MAELNVGELRMEIVADGSAAISEINRVEGAAQGAAQSMNGLGDGADGASAGLSRVSGSAQDAAEGTQRAGRSLKELGESLTKAGEKLSKFVTLPIVGLMTASVKGASDLTETLGKTDVVFGEMSERVLAWSESSVQAMGLAQGSALDFASTYGDMATGMGLTIDQATEMSMNLTQLAADLASFKNISTDLAAQKLNAVFTGETEGLKQLGVVMTQTNLQAFALAQGIEKDIKDMSQAEQVTLRYRYVMEATKNAQGDFARTGDSLANQSRKLGETVKQLGESFGARLIPMVTPVVARMQGLAQSFAELDGGMKNTIISIAAVAAAVGPVLLIGGKVLTLIASLKAAVAALSLNPVLLGLAGLAAAVAGVIALKSALDNANRDVDKTSEAYTRMRDALADPVDVTVSVDDGELSELEIPEAQETQVSIVTHGGDLLKNAVDAVDHLDGETFGTVVNIDGERTDVDAMVDDVVSDINELSGQVTITANGDAILNEEAGGTLAKVQAKLNQLKAAVPFVADETSRALLESQIQALQAALDGLSAGVTTKVTIVTGGEEALNNAVEAAQNINGKTFGAVVNIDGERTDVDALAKDVVSDINELSGQVTITANGDAILNEEAGGTLAKVQDKLDKLKAAVPFVANEASRALLESQIQALQDALNGLGAGVTVGFDLDTDAEKNAQAFKDMLADVPADKTYKATGVFEMPKSTKENVDAYTEAMNAAATATGHYKDAVEAMNKAVDTDTEEKIKAVNKEMDAQLASLTRAKNSGELDEEKFQQQGRAIIDAATAQVAAIEAAAERQKQANEILANGSREDDYGFVLDMYSRNVTDGINADDTVGAMNALQQAQEAGTLGAEQYTEAQVAVTGAMDVARGQLASMAAAQETYNASMAAADAQEQAAEETYSRRTAQIDKMNDALDVYANMLYAGNSGGAALAQATEGMDADTAEKFAAAVTKADGSLVSLEETMGSVKAIEDQQAAAEEAHTAALDAAAQQRQAATDALKTSLSEAASAYGEDVEATADGLNGMLDAAEQAGATVDETSRGVITGAQEMVTGALAAIKSGADPAQAMAEKFAGLEELTEEAGGNVAAGYAEGMASGEGTADSAGEVLGQAGVDGVNSGAGTASPSTKTAETGRNVVAGFANGMSETGPATAAATALGTAAVEAAATAAGEGGVIGEVLDEAAAGGMSGEPLASAASSAASSAAARGASSAGSAGRMIGLNLMSGAAAGVRSAASQLATQAAEAVRQAVAAAKAAAAIQSPSRVMRDEVGVMLTRGVTVGVEQEIPTARARIQQATRSLISGAAAVTRRETGAATATGAAAAPGFDYAAMGSAMKDAMGEVRFGFSVGERQLAEATQTENSIAMAARARRVNAGYGIR